MEKNWALSVDQCWLQVLVVFIDLPSILLWCNGFATIQKAIVDQMGSRLPDSDHDFFFGASLALGSALELLGLTTELAIAVVIYNAFFCHMSQSDWEMVHCCVEEDNTSEWRLFWFPVSWWDTHLSSLFTFPVCFKHQMTIDWSMLSSLATSFVVVRGPVRGSMMAVSWSLSTSDVWSLRSSSSRLSPLQNLLNCNWEGLVLTLCYDFNPSFCHFCYYSHTWRPASENPALSAWPLNWSAFA